MKEEEMEKDVMDKLLKIHTSGRDDTISNFINYPYEPTPYSVLERLANAGYIRKNNCVLDYGCGKGRVGFYLSYQTRCKSVGLDYDERLIRTACENKKHAVSGNKVEFVNENAAFYPVPSEVDRCYFFNPFSREILEKVLSRIEESYYDHPREILLFFYYPSDEFVAKLMTQPLIEFMDEISCRDLFDGNDEREKILIFRIE